MYRIEILKRECAYHLFSSYCEPIERSMDFEWFTVNNLTEMRCCIG